jgi:disulfide bond formation protein DsbB
MYPLVVLLGIATWRRDRSVRPYGLALAGLGLPIAGYHYLLEWFPQLESTACDPTNPCTLVWVRLFGYLSIPLMAATAFVGIAVLLGTLDAAPSRSYDRGRTR